MARDSLGGDFHSDVDTDVDDEGRAGSNDDEHDDDGAKEVNESQAPPNNDGEQRSNANENSNGNNNNNNNNTQQVEDDDEEESNLLFSCQCDSARTIATLLSCLRRVVTASTGSSSWSSSHGGGGNTQTQRTGTQSTSVMAVSGASANKIQHATVYAGPNGLTFHVQHGLAKQSQCSVDMPKGLFKEYFVGEEEVWLEDSDVEHDDDENQNRTQSTQGGGQKEIIQGGEFGVNLTTVLECFSILSKTGTNKPSSSGGGAVGSDGGGKSAHIGEYASLSNVPLCMSYDRGTATFHLEFLEGGSLSDAGGDAATAANIGGHGGCLVTCEVPGVAVADDVDDGPDDEEDANNASTSGLNANNNSGLASAFRSSALLSRAILYSDALLSAVAELYDVPGASIVQISLSKTGMELGTVGPRSEVWVNVPYHRGQGGMYVGLECYKPNVPLFGIAGEDGNIVRKYPLGAFLSGMRGLDIGVETCISVNARGMMAIQHQVSRDGYYDYSEDGDRNVRPSFVDFIMTSMEDEEDENDGDTMISQDNASVALSQHSGLEDITNTGSNDDLDVVGDRRKVVAKSRGRGRAKAAPRREEQTSSEEEEEEERPTRKAGRKGKQHDQSTESGDNIVGGNGGDIDFGNDHHDEYQDADTNNAHDEPTSMTKSSRNNAAETSRIMGELEMDQDMLSSRNRAGAGQSRMDALEDIRRRRREQRLRHQSRSDEDQIQNNNKQQQSNDGSGSDDHEKYHSKRSGSKRSSRRSKRSRRNAENGSNSDSNSSDDDEDNQQTEQTKRHHSPTAQDSQSQSEDDDDNDNSDGDETENEGSLDVTADIPLLFSKRSSLSTSRHGRGSRGRRISSRGSYGMGGDSGGEEKEEHDEPRMMYGDTKLEFTQDSYDGD